MDRAKMLGNSFSGRFETSGFSMEKNPPTNCKRIKEPRLLSAHLQIGLIE